MITDLAGLGAMAEVACDVCIVGAGAAGVAIARELAGSGLAVCLTESGGLEPEPAGRELNDGVVVGAPMALQDGRARAFGGATSLWTGRCTAFDAIDFETRPWVPRSGWPIDRATLEPYYRRAEPYCGFDRPWTDEATALAEATAAPLPQFDPTLLTPHVWRYAPRAGRVYVDFGKEHGRALEAAPGVRVLLHATLTDFIASENREHVEAIVVRCPDGGSARIAARSYVLACGGVANAALLLQAAREAGGGFGGDRVGLCFQQHPRGTIATVDADAKLSARLQRTFAIFPARSGVQYEVGWALSPDVQRSEQLLNASVIATYTADPRSGWESAKAVMGDLREGKAAPDLLRRLGRIALQADDVAMNVLRRAQDRHAILRAAAIDLVVDLEQEPNPASRIRLSDKRDMFGSPLPEVDWRFSEAERRTARRFAEILAAEFARLGLGRVEPADWVGSRRPLLEAPLRDTYHHIGATRMSADAATGVVDASCRVHGMDNLYVAGASVFPTGGHANPTFTIVALAIRLADHLKASLKG